MKKFMFMAAFLLGSGVASADSWTGSITISSIEPMIVAEGGVVEVGPSTPTTVPFCGNASGQATAFDLVFTNGTQETRSALIAALYLALSESKPITLLLSSSGCSAYGYPVIVGMNIGA